jgi:glycosyltransferase involved in cell wall biosynthesis
VTGPGPAAQGLVAGPRPATLPGRFRRAGPVEPIGAVGAPRVSETARSASWTAGASPEVSVVVSTHGRAGFLAGLAAALEAQTLSSDRFEVVVVDDASTDGTWSALESIAAGTSLRLCALRLAANVGQGQGRNAGVAAARAPVVAFTDDDCLPTPQWLEALTLPVRCPAGPVPRAVVAQGATRGWPEDAEQGGPWARTVWVHGPTWLFETCNIAYRRRDFERAGGFPARGDAPVAATGRLVGEDAILGWRVVEGGADLEFVPAALVHHRHLPARYVDWLAEQRGRGAFPALVGRSPFGRRALWRRWFLAPRTAALDLAVASAILAVATRRPALALGGAPWVWAALPEAAARRGRHPLVRLAQVGLGDVVGLGALVAASVRHRRPVL